MLSFAKVRRMNPADPVTKACEVVGGQAELARRLGVTPAAVQQWRSGKRPVPALQANAIERETEGAVTRRDLRPDDAHLIWPDLAISEPNQPSALAESAQAAIKTEVKEGANA